VSGFGTLGNKLVASTTAKTSLVRINHGNEIVDGGGTEGKPETVPEQQLRERRN
jgi:hypothetical protein